jgi:hypothetical protein
MARYRNLEPKAINEEVYLEPSQEDEETNLVVEAQVEVNE